MEGVDHVHIIQIGGSGLIGKVDRMLQGQVPDGEGLKLGIAGIDAPLVIVIQLTQAGSHFAAARAGSRYYDQGMAGLNVVIFAQALIADDMGHIGGISGDGIVPVAADPQLFQPVKESVRRILSAVTGQHHAAHIQPHVPENINQAEDVLIIGDTQIPPHFILLNVPGVDGDDDLHIILQLLKHPDLAVRFKARQYPGGMIVVKQLPAEFQIQLPAELVDPLFDLFRLRSEIFLIVKPNGSHDERPLSFVFKHINKSIAQAVGFGKMPGKKR